MNLFRLVIAAIGISVAMTTVQADVLGSDLAALELERSCGNCHDVLNPGALSGDNWLAQLKAMGPIKSLTTQQRTEVAGFLRHHGWEVNQILAMTNERHLFEEKCGLCHSVERAFIEKLDDDKIKETVMRMQKRAPQWISDDNAKTIVEFMRNGARGVRRPEHGAISGGPAEVFRGRCAGCHPLERSYLYLETTLDPAWPLLVKRMQLKAPAWISDSEAGQIVEYLSELKPQLR